MENDDTLQSIGAVILVNAGTWLINNFNPVLGTVSLCLSCTYVGFKLWKEYQDMKKDNKKE